MYRLETLISELKEKTRLPNTCSLSLSINWMPTSITDNDILEKIWIRHYFLLSTKVRINLVGVCIFIHFYPETILIPLKRIFVLRLILCKTIFIPLIGLQNREDSIEMVFVLFSRIVFIIWSTFLWPAGLVVWFSLRVREVTGSIPV